MESLLRWSIENSTPANADAATSSEPPAPRRDLDPAILDHILGRPDAELMKEALAQARDESLDDGTRVEALDNLEMLVENIDNASDLERLKMWAPIHELLTSPNTPDALKTQALWVVGTAIQNNPSAQSAYFLHEPSPLPVLLSFLRPSVRASAQRSKGVYALSGLLKHNRAAVSALDSAGGWPILRDALHDSDIAIRRKVAFLLNTLLLASAPPAESNVHGNAADAEERPVHPNPAAPVHANSHAAMLSDPSSTVTAEATLDAFRVYDVIPTVVRELVRPTPYGLDGETEGDADLEEKLIRLLHTYATTHKGPVSDEDKVALRKFLSLRGSDVLGLESSEKEELDNAFR